MQEVVEQVLENGILSSRGKRKVFQEQALSRVGETRINNLGSLMIVDQYNNSQDIWVRFPQGNMVNCTWQQFISGNVKNVYDRSIFGVGYLGDGFYKPSVNGEPTQQYKTWVSMLMRCYSLKHHEKHPSYIGCSVAEEWHCFQNFAKWYDENFYEIEGYKTHLDKDILVKGNKLYSPETCVFVPQFINGLFVKRDNHRGNLPIGVKRCSRNTKKYEVQARNNTGKRKYAGIYDTPEEAFQGYKEFKENYIKEVAEEHKDKIPSALFSALMNYKVEIND